MCRLCVGFRFISSVGKKSLKVAVMDLTQAQFDVLSRDLRQIVLRIPLAWGHIQNNPYDRELEKVCNIFDVVSLSDFENHITGFDADHKQYYLRRWFILRCAECDEFLFYKNEGVEHNPNRFDKKWDIRIKNGVQFDVKGTIIPHCFQYYYGDVLANPSGIVEYYYDHQSPGKRYDMQNRLFIVHHSLAAPERELKIRCGWRSKEYVFSSFVKEVDNIHFMSYKGQMAGVIFLVETAPGELQYIISGLDTELKSIPH